MRGFDFRSESRVLQQQCDRDAHERALLRTRRFARRVGRRRIDTQRHVRAPIEFGQHQIAERAVGNLREQRPRALGEPRLAVEAGEIHIAAQVAEEEFRQRRGRFQAFLEAGLALVAHERIGVFALGQEQEKRLAAVAHAWQHRLDCLPRRAAARAVAVEAKVDVGTISEKQLGMVARRRRAERGDGLGDAVLEQRDHVHVAFDDDQARNLRVRLAHLPEREQLLAFVEQRGFR